MAPRKNEPLRIFKHKELMDKINDFFITLKVNLHEFDCDTDEKREAITKLKLGRPKPTVEELDEIMIEILDVLKQESEEMIKY